MPLKDAVKYAVDECICENILADFLKKNKAEVIQLSIFEYDEERHNKTLREEGFEDGFQAGEERGIQIGERRVCESFSVNKVFEGLL